MITYDFYNGTKWTHILDSFGGRFDNAKTLEELKTLRGLNNSNSKNFKVEEI